MHTYKKHGPPPVSSKSCNYFSRMDFCSFFLQLFLDSTTNQLHSGYPEPQNRLKVEKDMEKHWLKTCWQLIRDTLEEAKIKLLSFRPFRFTKQICSNTPLRALSSFRECAAAWQKKMCGFEEGKTKPCIITGHWQRQWGNGITLVIVKLQY